MSDLANDTVARQVTKAVLQRYNALPKKGKPRHGEWTLVAAVVCSIADGKVEPRCVSGRGCGHRYCMLDIHTVSLGTGCKCIGKSKLSCDGEVSLLCICYVVELLYTGWIVNDSHAEIIARRGFIR